MNTTNPICRNCGGSEFYTRDLTLSGDAGVLLPLGGVTHGHDCRLRVCGGCGLADWFVTASNLNYVKKKFKREE